MPTDRPTSVEILQAIEGFLQEKVAPQVDCHTQFHLKVTANLLRLLQREWTQGSALELAELARLQALLHSDSDDVAALNLRQARAPRVLTTGRHGNCDYLVVEPIPLEITAVMIGVHE